MKSVQSFIYNVASTTEYVRGAVGGISNMLTEIGLPKTADTGQVDIATLAVPATSTAFGYEIRTWTVDGNTLYLKFEYVTGTNTSRFGFRLTIGTGSNGAGTITGILSNFNLWSWGDAAQTHTPYFATHYACNSNGSIAINLTGYYYSAPRPTFLFLDRQRNPVTGAIIPNGVFGYAHVHGPVAGKCWSPTYNADSTDGRYVCPNPGYSQGGSGIPPGNGKRTEVMPFFGAWPEPAIQPVANMFWGPEMPLGYTYSVDVYGQKRTYLTIAKYTSSYLQFGCFPNAVNTSIVGLGMVWE